MSTARLGWLALVAGLAACGSSPAFSCSDDAECGDGRCEPSSGYCSFLDEGCDSGWKYGAHAGSGLAGECVGPAGGSGDDGSGEATQGGPGPGSAPDDGGGTTTASAGSDGPVSETDAPTCDGTCLDAPPPGWLGPVGAVVGTDAIPSCPPELPTTVELGHTMLAAAPATCECACAPVVGSCGEITMTVDQVGGVCGDGNPIDLAEDACVQGTTASDSVTIATPAALSGTCDDTSSSQVDPPAWLDHLRVCASDSAASCAGGEACLPSVPGTDACIVRDGDVPCPAGAYSERTVIFGDYLDERDCSPCQCSVSTSVCRVELRAGDTCSGSPDASWPTNAAHCETFDVPVGGSFTAQYDTFDNCTADGGAPVGDATPVDPTTLCCVP